MFFFGCEEEEGNVGEGECLLYGSWELFYFMDNAQDDCEICQNTPMEDVPCSEKNTSIIPEQYYEGGCPSVTFSSDGTYIDLEGSSNTWSGGCSVNDTIQLNNNSLNNNFAVIIAIAETMVSLQGGDGTYVFKK